MRNLVVVAALLSATPAFATGTILGKVPMRAGLSLGAWSGNVSETVGTQTSSIRVAPAYGATLYLGLTLGPIFVDYSPSYLGVGKLGSAESTSNSYYLSWKSFEAGLTFKTLPIEPYVGYELGNLAFTTGTQTNFEGSAIKAGINVGILRTSPLAHLGLRAEYRKHFASINNFGAPIEASTSIYSYFAGLVFMFSD